MWKTFYCKQWQLLLPLESFSAPDQSWMIHHCSCITLQQPPTAAASCIFRKMEKILSTQRKIAEKQRSRSSPQWHPQCQAGLSFQTFPESFRKKRAHSVPDKPLLKAASVTFHNAVRRLLCTAWGCHRACAGTFKVALHRCGLHLSRLTHTLAQCMIK